MGVPYHKLLESRRAKTGLRTKAWVIVRRAAAKAVRLCMARRRLAAMYMKRVACPGLWARVRRAVTGSRPTPVTSYDSDGYARNFDDGRWKEEEEEFWKTGSFAYRFGGSGRFVT